MEELELILEKQGIKGKRLTDALVWAALINDVVSIMSTFDLDPMHESTVEGFLELNAIK